MTAPSPEAVRDFLRQAADLGSWTAADAARFLGLDAARTKQAIAALEVAGYVAQGGKRGSWTNTDSGNAMAGVSAARPIRRETADDKLDEFLERVHKVNDDPHYLFRVGRAVVYGPYLTKSASLTNIDLAVELTPKQKDARKHETAMNARAEEAKAAGKRFASFRAAAEWGRREVLDFLKGRSRAIELKELTGFILAQPHRDLL